MGTKRDHHYRIGGIVWLWRYTRLRGEAAGWAYLAGAANPDKQRKVLIDSRLKNRARLETEIHEALHCCFPQMSEDAITQAGSDLSKILWALGYRLKEEQ